MGSCLPDVLAPVVDGLLHHPGGLSVEREVRVQQGEHGHRHGLGQLDAGEDEDGDHEGREGDEEEHETDDLLHETLLAGARVLDTASVVEEPPTD